jgi:hypothetical protein
MHCFLFLFLFQRTNIKAKKPYVIFFSNYCTKGALIMLEARKLGVKVNMFGGGYFHLSTNCFKFILYLNAPNFLPERLNIHP